MDICNHSIELRNFGESFMSEIAVIYGTLSNVCEKDTVVADINSQVIHSKIFRKTFKFVLRLKKDSENVVTLKYCNAVKKLMIQQKISDNIFYDIQPIYIIPKNHDGKFQSHSESNTRQHALRKIDLLLELAKCVICSKLKESEFEEERYLSIKPCICFESQLDVETARSLNQYELHDHVANELIENYGKRAVERVKFVGYMSCTKFHGLSNTEEYSYANIAKKTECNPALSSQFLTLLGSGCFYTWPNVLDEVLECFKNKTLVDTKILFDDSNYRKTYGGCFSTSLGSLIHEMGHLFDLGHTINGLMGNDIDFAHRFFLNENFTENVSKRTLSICQQQSLAPENAMSNRLTKFKKENGFLEKYHQQKSSDMTFYEQNCLVTLYHHKWFTQNLSNATVEFIKDTRKIVSDDFLALVEVRELEDKNSIVRQFWNLVDKNVFEFSIPHDIKLTQIAIFAITINGCILRISM
jgi:Putative peptidase family